MTAKQRLDASTPHMPPRLAVQLFQLARGQMKGLHTMAAIVLVAACSIANANDFPTVARVEFVLECLRDHKGAEFELMNKCSCVVDRLAEKYEYDGFVELQTMAKAVTIAGERGSTLRDNDEAQKAAKQYRADIKDAAKACFLR